MKKLTAVFLCLLLCFAPLCGCDRAFALTCRIGEYPVSLDPQIASTRLELTVAQNAFEGLMRFDESGAPVPAAAESYSVSDDGLTYTFTLRKGLLWSNGTALTAADFKFGLERATASETKAPCGYMLSSVLGAAERLKGENAALGISINGDSLIIRLRQADDSFLSVLCHPVASPCLESYFTECGGRYGMDAKHIISNGSYKISFMDEGKTVRLVLNANYGGPSKAVCTGITFDFKPLDEEKIYTEQLLKGSWDIGYVTEQEALTVKAGGASLVSDYDAVYFLLFNPKATVCKSDALRESYCLGFSDVLPEGYRPAVSILPDAVTVYGKRATALDGIAPTERACDPGTARELFFRHADRNVLGTVNSISVLCPEESSANEILRSVVNDWQKNLGTYFNIKTESEAALEKDLASGSYSIALALLRSDDLTALGMLKAICDALGEPEELKARLADAESSRNSADLVRAANAFSAVLSEQHYAIPLVLSATSYAYTDSYEGLAVNPNALIDFTMVRKK